MLFKVIGDFTKVNFMSPKLNKYNYTYYNGILYISDTKETSVTQLKESLKSLFHNCKMCHLTKDKIVFEPYYIQNWCYNQLLNSEIIQYETKQQKQLKKTMEQLNKIEKIIFEIKE